MSAPWMDPVLRAACREQLMRELFLRLMIHDVRNPLTPIVGALELLQLEGVRVPGYLSQSLERLSTQLNAYESLRWGGRSETSPEQIQAALGIPVSGEGGLPLAPLRLLSALELAAPAAGSIRREGGALQLALTGLSPEATLCAIGPSYEVLAPRLAAPDAVLGAALLRTVFRDAGGQVRPVPADPAGLVLML